MKYVVRKSFVDVVGHIWMPNTVAAMRYPLSNYDIENIRQQDDGIIDREAVEQWLTCHSGDFQSIEDFSASIEDGDKSIDIPWDDEDSEYTFSDLMYPSED